MNFIKNIFKDMNQEYIIGLNDELKGIYIKNYYDKINKNIVVVTNTLFEANKIYKIISNYTDNVLFFPMDDFLTSEALAISPEFKITRLETLNSLLDNCNKIVITNLMGYLRYLPSKKDYQNSFIKLNINDEYPIKKLVKDLINCGYSREVIVNKTGDIAVRGFVVDVFPVGNKNPIRIEYWGDQIESIRLFDEDNQYSISNIDEIIIKPNVESVNKKVNINDYLNKPTVFNINCEDIETGYKVLQEEIFNYNIEKERDQNYSYMNDLKQIKEHKDIKFYQFDNISVDSTLKYNSYNIDKLPMEKGKLNKVLNDYLKQKKIVIICVNDRYKLNKIIDYLENDNIIITDNDNLQANKINLIIKKITEGFKLDKYIVISERELFNKQEINVNYKTNFRYGTKIKDITKLNIGDYVVHNTHGIGKYIGLKTLTKNKILKDYLTIEYKGGDKLYIPVEKIDLISKYSSNENIKPKVNKLGSSEWTKTKMHVRKKIENIAGELLKLYANREASKGYSFIKDDDNQIEFENKFIYNDTIDQHRVSEEIKRDMEKEQPMDRLLCGDVGYGKTEVAFRAMYKAVLSGKQVAYLCPTTILSKQHYQNALNRFDDTGVNIALLNRFVTPAKAKQIISQLKTGKIDIVIGTHRILSKDITFKDLGLLVIDEEQRFGVKHKEKIKEIKNNIDVLTLTATPIPRTLQMSIAGVRSLSLIETPPVNRYPVQTYVLEENKLLLKDAIYKELSRDGQVFLLFNNVAHIEQKKQELEKLIPEAKIIYAHGQMSKTELENIMEKFINKEYDILICTTIIETGIDIPNVNTLIILDADHFGLSQLYQIRGRVGRSDRIAYCYLMYQTGKILSDVAKKRLNVIKEFTELGSGFNIAMRDLSIRGAGDILGSEQAGFIDSVGIELYLSMLNEEINHLKGKNKVVESKEEQPLLDVETAINDQYVEEEDLKIEIHKKINTINSYSKLLEVKKEIEDRFGKITENLLIYMYEEWFEKMAEDLKIKQVKQTNNFIEMRLSPDLSSKVNGDLLFIMATDITRNFRFGMRQKNLIITLDLINLNKHFIFYLVEILEVLKKAIQ